MPCYTPLKAYRAEGGRVVFSSKEGFSDRPLELPCGQCSGCRLQRSREWALRCVHEAQLHDRNCFITLTYRPEDLPADGSLDVRDWQLFAKRARKKLGKFRFLHCGEYGEENFRPHYHACVFGQDFKRSEWREHQVNKNGDMVYTSKCLEDLWEKGFVTIGDLTWQSAAYVARYVMKKESGKRLGTEASRYRRIDLTTGEEYHVKPEYITMSRRPGLASEWYSKFKGDVFPDDFVAHDGQKHRPPKFYDKLLEKEDSQALERLKRKRRDAAYKRREELTPERLAVREAFQAAKTTTLKRQL